MNRVKEKIQGQNPGTPQHIRPAGRKATRRGLRNKEEEKENKQKKKKKQQQRMGSKGGRKNTRGVQCPRRRE